MPSNSALSTFAEGGDGIQKLTNKHGVGVGAVTFRVDRLGKVLDFWRTSTLNTTCIVRQGLCNTWKAF